MLNKMPCYTRFARINEFRKKKVVKKSKKKRAMKKEELKSKLKIIIFT